MRLPAIVVLVLVLTAIAGVTAPTASAITCEVLYGQAGTAIDPFLVDSVAKLAAVDSCSAADAHFRQTADLDLGGTPWTPIGTLQGFPFRGTYDGGGHRITGLVVDETSAPNAAKGLFGYVDGGTIRNLTIDGAQIDGGVSYYGVLAGDLDGGLVEDVRITRSRITATNQTYFGGLAGGATGATVRRVTVESLRIDVSGAANSIGGVLGSSSGGAVEQVTVRDATISGPGFAVGGAVGQLATGTLTDATVVGGSVAGDTNVGGLVGRSCMAVVTRGTASVSVSATVGSAGGAIGQVSGVCDNAFSMGSAEPVDAVVDVQASGAVTAAGTVGGLIGHLGDGAVRRSYATGAATSSGTGVGAGGLIGTADGGAIADAYATGAVTAPSDAGGLIGRMYANGVTVTRAYATGRVRGEASAGGFIGDGAVCPVSMISVCSLPLSAVTASFWDVETSGQPTSPGNATGRTTAQMRERATFTGASWPIASGWEAAGANTWGICEGDTYPFLLRQYDAATQPCAGPPSAPLRPRLSANGGVLRVTWETPSSDGGAPITGYTATATAVASGKATARTCTTDGSGRRCLITGLRNGTLYRVAITATNRKGTGTAATVAGRPRPSLTVLRVRVVDGAIVTRVRVTGAGRLQQVGRRGDAPACTVRTTARRAGVVVLTCRLNAATRAAADGTVRLTTRFRPTGWRWTTDVRAVPLGGAPQPVTG